MKTEILQVGPDFLANGSSSLVQGGRNAEVIVSELHGKFYTQAFQGNLFSAVQTAGVTVLTAGATTASFALANPLGSGKLLVPVRFEMVITVTPATPVLGAYALYVNVNPAAAVVTGTALVPIPAMVGTSTQPAGKPFTTATLPVAPTLWRLINTRYTGAVTTIPNMPALAIDFDGTAILTPGSTLSLQQIAGDSTNASALCAIIWEEVLA